MSDEGRQITKAEAGALARIKELNDPNNLRTMMDNASRGKSQVVYDAAFRRLLEMLPQEDPGSVAHDFWRTIHAFEELLTRESGARQHGCHAPVRRSKEWA